MTSVRIAYFTALLADESVRLTEESVERVRKTLEETQAMNRAGLASEYDVLRQRYSSVTSSPTCDVR